MDKLIIENLNAIRAICKSHNVSELYLFGSAVHQKLKTNSDIDFLYVFDKEKIQKGKYADNFFELLFELENLLGKKIDLLPLKELKNPYFIQSIEKDKLKLYEA